MTGRVLRFRYLNYLYARFFHYFWIPCPLCGKMFGGHEVGEVSINHTEPQPTGTGWFYSTSELTCKEHQTTEYRERFEFCRLKE